MKAFRKLMEILKASSYDKMASQVHRGKLAGIRRTLNSIVPLKVSLRKQIQLSRIEDKIIYDNMRAGSVTISERDLAYND